jgi:UPF0755 protein
MTRFNRYSKFMPIYRRSQAGLIRGLLVLFALSLTAVAGAGAYAWHSYKNQLIALPQKPIDFKVVKGAGVKQVAVALNAKGVKLSPSWFWLVSRLRGDANLIKAGTYRLTDALTLEQLLNKVVAGEVILTEIRFIEGWTFV